MFKALANLFSAQPKNEEIPTIESEPIKNNLNQNEFIEKLKINFFDTFGRHLNISEADGFCITFSYQFVPVHLCKVNNSNVTLLTSNETHELTENTIVVIIEEARQQMARLQ